MKYLISISYDGSRFNGFQRLNTSDGVQNVIEKALTKIAKKKIEIKGAGRTDKNVHALDQKAHFDLDFDINPNNLKRAINGMVKPYIYVTDCKKVSKDFHARFSVKRKKYVYKINLGNYDPLKNDYYNQEFDHLNINKMKKASKYFIGQHNFKNFVSGERDNYDSIIYNINFKRDKNQLIIEFIGKSFYRYMVRNLVGALLEVGRLKIKDKVIKEMMDSPNIDKKLPTAPPEGLYLIKVEY